MAVTVIVGAQWGDEGKGKIVDLLSKNCKAVARFQGGANAGHTVYYNDLKVVLHQIPSGIFRSGCKCVLGNGMVVDPIGLFEEIQMVKSYGFNLENQIFISFNAHIVTPIHKAIDNYIEKNTNNRIGTTGRGIGPTYVDKYDRNGIRALDLLEPNNLYDKIDKALDMATSKGLLPLEFDKLLLEHEMKSFYKCVDKIKPLIADTFNLIHNLVDNNENILIEGAQGTLLDVDHGTYPFVTSSSASTAGIGTGLGLPGTKLDTVIGVMKAYITRVGNGPFPTELFDEAGKKLQTIGKEFGATTGRPRRCGWFDAVAARYSCKVNGLTDIALTKLDILDNFKEIKVCVGYKFNNLEIFNMSEIMHLLDDVKPIYKTFKGWSSKTTGIDKYKNLPNETRIFLDFIADYIDTPISIISTGPSRHDIIQVN